MPEVYLERVTSAPERTLTRAILATSGAVNGFNHSGGYVCTTGNWGVYGLQLPSHQCRDQDCARASELLAVACALKTVSAHKIPITLLVSDEEVFKALIALGRQGSARPSWPPLNNWGEGYAGIRARLNAQPAVVNVHLAGLAPHLVTSVVGGLAQRGLQILATNRPRLVTRQESAITQTIGGIMAQLYS